MVNVRKPIIENRVYCEILFRLGTYKYHATQLHSDFYEFGEDKPSKSIQAVARDLKFLAKEGYLDFSMEDAEGKPSLKNRKYYSVNYDKLIDDFLTRVLRFKPEAKKEISSSFRKKCKKNRLIRITIAVFLEETRRSYDDLSTTILSDLFDSLIKTGYIEDLFKHHLVNSSKKNYEKRWTELIHESLQKEYNFYEEFLEVIRLNTGINHFVQHDFPLEMSVYLLNGLDDQTVKDYRL